MIRDAELLQDMVLTVRRFVAERLVPLEAEVARTDRIPASVADEMRHLGLFGMTIPEEYGGLGFTAEEEVLVAMELGRTSPAFRSLIGTNNGIGSQGILLDGTEAQRQEFLPLLASGEIVGSFALTEPDAGSDAASLRTSAERDGDHYVLDGTKRYITNAPEADLFTVMARTDPTQKGSAGITAFLVPAETPGITIGEPERKMGQQGTHVADVVFAGCRVPETAIIGGLGRLGMGFKTAMKVLDRGRLHISAVCVGVAERLIADALEFAQGREQFGRPIAQHQLVQAMLADSRTEAYAARSMVLDAARRRDDGERITMVAAACKLFASEMVGRVADRAVQIHGGAGYIADYAVERFYRDVRLFRLYEGTSQIQQLVIAREMINGATV
ncbi:MAG TPA: acyl-CoA dehydrogenase family protein [Acidimicrobiia bacterium]|nr:acyl-CoA dehydrogenase family protein [Acidimicrobiia bacterium]